MLNAIELKFAPAQRPRCVAHKRKNLLGSVPKERQPAVEPELKTLFSQESRDQADQALAAFCLKFEKPAPTAVACLRRDRDSGLTFSQSALENQPHQQQL